MPTPTLREMELLLALASSDGIAGASATLGISPSATSHALDALEAAPGTELIDTWIVLDPGKLGDLGLRGRCTSAPIR